jgi:hypothetical protein
LVGRLVLLHAQNQDAIGVYRTDPLVSTHPPNSQIQSQTQTQNSFAPKKKAKWEMSSTEKLAEALKLKDDATGLFKV